MQEEGNGWCAERKVGVQRDKKKDESGFRAESDLKS